MWLLVSLFSLATDLATAQTYANCQVVSSALDYRLFWTVRGNQIDISFRAKSSGYVCGCLQPINGPAFTTGGHPGSGTVDCACAYGGTLTDSYMQEEDVNIDAVDSFTNKRSVTNGTHTTASYTRPLVGSGTQDVTIPVTGTQLKWVWAVHPTSRNNGQSRHPRGSVAGSESNAGSVAVNFGGSSQCDVAQVAGSFKSGAGDFELKYGPLPTDSSTFEFTMSAATTGWISFGWTAGTGRAHVDTDMYMGVFTGGTCAVTDLWSTTKSSPALDGAQSIVAGSQSCSIVNGRLTVTFRRQLNTGDRLTDSVLYNAPVLFQWAYATSSNPAQIHAATGTAVFNFFATPPGVPAVTLPPTPKPTPAPAPVTTGSSISADAGNFKLSWVISGASIDLTIEARTNGYVGIGWTDASGRSHIATDMLIAWVDDSSAAATLVDAFSTGKSKPRTDATPHGAIQSSSQTGGVTRVVIRRPLSTGDAADDKPIPSGAPVLFQWCYHSNDNYNGGETHDKFGSLVVSFGSNVQPTQPPPTPSPTPKATPPPAVSGNSVQVDSGRMKISWALAGTAEIDITLEAQAAGYIGIGWAAQGGRSHVASDMVVAWVDGAGAGQILDTFSSSKSKPRTDSRQDVALTASSQTAGVTKVTFRRKLDTGDATQDVAIPAAPLLVQWCYHSTDAYEAAETHDAFGSLLLNFRSASQPPQPPATTTAAAPTAPPPSVTGTSVSLDGGEMTVSWGVDASDAITFDIAARTNGYVSIGWCAANGAVHKASDMLVGWVDDATSMPTLLDVYSSAKSKPPTDATQDATVVSSSQAGGWTRMSIRRKLTTADSKDVPITNAPLLFQWAYHSIDSFPAGDTHARAGSLLVHFLSAEQPPQPPATSAPQPPAPAPGGAPTPGLYVGDDGKIRIAWRVNREIGRIYFDVDCGVIGYCAIGFARIGDSRGGKGHAKADMYVMWVDDKGEAKLLDTYSDKLELPVTDGDQNIEEITGTQDADSCAYSFSRLLTTPDKDADLSPFADEIVLLQWAMHDSDALEYHSYSGKSQVNLLSDKPVSVVDFDVDKANGPNDTEPLAPVADDGGLSGLEIGLIVAAAICLVMITAALINIFLVRRRALAKQNGTRA
jgi:hypothetical protein